MIPNAGLRKMDSMLGLLERFFLPLFHTEGSKSDMEMDVYKSALRLKQYKNPLHSCVQPGGRDKINLICFHGGLFLMVVQIQCTLL